MGLFDTIELYDDVHLPEYPDGVAHAVDVDWQTKGIDRPSMTTFRITADGRLLEEEWHTDTNGYNPVSDFDPPWGRICSRSYSRQYEEVPPEERPHADRDDVEEDDLLYLAGSLNRVHDGWTERDSYHGRFEITHSFEELDSLVTYQVTFTHGRLEGFERLR
jgi:hypothetical protein